jgi:hypothetical protein
MRYFKEINLPLPVNEQVLHEFLEDKKTGNRTFNNLKYVYFRTDLRDKLNPELVELFDSLNIFPSVMQIQGHVGNKSFCRDLHLVHVDMIHTGESIVDVPFAINWELTDTDPTLYWWDTKDSIRINPIVKDPALLENEWFIHGLGAHYGERLKKVSNPADLGYDLLAEYRPIKNKAFLLNTTIPHSAVYPPGSENRVCFSLRFPIDQIPSWEIASNIFK